MNQPPLTDEVINTYFDYVRFLREDTARRLREHDKTPIGRHAGDPSSALAQWLLLSLLDGAAGAERAWPVLLTLIARAPDRDALGYIGASGLERILDVAEPQFMQRYAEQAQADPRFREALAHLRPPESAHESTRALIIAARQTLDPRDGPHR